MKTCVNSGVCWPKTAKRYAIFSLLLGLVGCNKVLENQCNTQVLSWASHPLFLQVSDSTWIHSTYGLLGPLHRALYTHFTMRYGGYVYVLWPPWLLSPSKTSWRRIELWDRTRWRETTTSSTVWWLASLLRRKVWTACSVRIGQLKYVLL